jgi:APA family basic amino acid/polyamine antiporter
VFTSAVEKIINYTIFLDSIGMSTSAACLFILRKRKIGEERGDVYRMRLFPLMPLVFILAYISIAASIVIDDPRTAGYGVLVFISFFVLYFIIRRAKGRTTAEAKH